MLFWMVFVSDPPPPLLEYSLKNRKAGKAVKQRYILSRILRMFAHEHINSLTRLLLCPHLEISETLGGSLLSLCTTNFPS